MLHIYTCENINPLKSEIPHSELYNGNFKNQIEIFRRFNQNMEKRNEMKSGKNIPCDPCDPLDCISLDLDK